MALALEVHPHPADRVGPRQWLTRALGNMKGPAGPFRNGRTILNQSLGSRGTGHLPAANVLAVVPENVDETGAWGRQKSPKPRCGSRSLVGAGYSGVSMSRWPRSGQGCSKASVNARPGDGRTWTNAYRSHPRHPSWDAWPRSSQVPSVWPLSRPIRSTSAFSSSLVATETAY